MGSENV
jgi:hypothetical protein